MIRYPDLPAWQDACLFGVALHAVAWTVAYFTNRKPRGR